uniref:Gamma-secretase subunit Aph-1 n=1 Tax=Ciona savignyi TaxID=51511 RepID=H2ZHA8_CIOSA
MTLLVFFGCTFIAFGPSLAMFILTIAKYPLKIILLVVGAFFWLLSLLFSALLWLAVVPLKDQLAFSLVFSVMIQEAMRFALFKVMEKAENGLDDALTDEEKDSISHHKLSYTTGFGFGLMYGLFSIVNVLSQSIGPGSVGISGHSENFILISAFLTSCFILLHTFWNVIVFNALKKKKYYWVFLVCGLHMLVSCFSLLNVQQNLSYVSLIISFCVLFFTTTWAFKVAGGSLVNLKACFNCNK